MQGEIIELGEYLIYNATHQNRQEIGDRHFTINKIMQDVMRSGLSIEYLHQRRSKKLLVSFVGEGHSAIEAQTILPWIKEVFVDYQIDFSFSTANTGNYPFRYRCWPLSLMNAGNWLDNLCEADVKWDRIILDAKFLCMNRRPSLVRERLIYLLHQNLKPHSLRASLGCASDEYRGPGIWINDSLLIDGIVDDSIKTQVINPRFWSCLFNIVSESSDQSDSDAWKNLMLSEKSFKPFAMRQIPLWMAVPGTVAFIRELGLDVFDDICDHSYDEIEDEDHRQDRLVQSVVALDKKYSIICCRKLRRNMHDRLLQNHQRLWDLAARESNEYNKWISDLTNAKTPNIW